MRTSSQYEGKQELITGVRILADRVENWGSGWWCTKLRNWQSGWWQTELRNWQLGLRTESQDVGRQS